MNKGYIFLILASIGYALMGIFIRTLNTEIPPFSQIFLRFLGSAAFSLIFVIISKNSLKPKKLSDLFILLFLGIFCFSLSTITFTYSILFAPLSTVLFILSTNIILTPLLGFILLGEKLSTNLGKAVTLSTIGTFLLFKPEISGLNLGALLAFITSFVTSLYYVGSRKLKSYPSVVITAYSTISALFVLGILALILEKPFYTHPPTQNIYQLSPFIWLIVLIFALDNFLSWLLTNKGFQTVKGGIGSIILLTEPLIGSILGYLIYKESISLTGILGILFILSGILLITKKG